MALWDIIKHMKDQYVQLLKMEEDVEGELSLHHDFHQSTATNISDMVQEIDKYLRIVCGSMLDQDTLKNVVTGEIVTKVNVDMLFRCIQEETDAYAKFMQDRLRSKTTFYSFYSFYSFNHQQSQVRDHKEGIAFNF